AYETQFGPSVQVRIIVSSSLDKARQVYAAAVQQPDTFPELAKQFSDDPSASAKGLIHPIRPHVGDPKLEQVAFALQPGQISEVIPVAEQFVILRCESHIPPRRVPMEEVKKTLYE